jgi:beta-lactam-binding protein with PASTA domain
MLGDSLRRRQPQKRPRRAGRKRLGARFWIPALLAALAVPFAAGYVIAAFMIFPQPDVEDGTGIAVPALRGMSTVEAERALAQAGLGRLQVTQLPDPGVPEGQVVAQSPLAGQQLQSGADVRVAVSSGAPRIRVPDVLGVAADRAEQALQRAGFGVQRTEGESPVAAGRVFAVDPPPGSVLRLPATVTIGVSLGPPAVDTMAIPPDTVPRAR